MRVLGERRGDEILVTVEDYADRASAGGHEDLVAAFERGALGGDVEVALGLAAARAIVRAHGGNTSLERPPAGGTRFRFSLPLEAAPAPETVFAVPAGNI